MAPPGLVYFVTGGLYLLTPSTHFAHTRNFILNNFLLWKVSHTRVTELHEEAHVPSSSGTRDCRHAAILDSPFFPTPNFAPAVATAT